MFLLTVSIVSAMPEPIISTQSEWKITHTTDEGFTPYLANSKDKKTIIGLIPNNNSCSGMANKRLYDE
jgi:hypothetical protein